MKCLMLLTVLFFISCSESPIEPDENILVYELKYDKNYDHDAEFKLIDGSVPEKGLIKQVQISTFNYSKDVDYNFYISDNQEEIFFSSFLNTACGTSTFIINVEYSVLMQIHIFRYETVKPVDFEIVLTVEER